MGKSEYYTIDKDPEDACLSTDTMKSSQSGFPKKLVWQISDVILKPSVSLKMIALLLALFITIISYLLGIYLYQ